MVCFSCGNATRELIAAGGMDVLSIGLGGDLAPLKWFSMSEIRNTWPDHFDATSGHLPIQIMNTMALAIRFKTGDAQPPQIIPSGSGETAVCYAMAYPHIRFRAVYDNSCPATEYNKRAPLNAIVDALCDVVIKPHSPVG